MKITTVVDSPLAARPPAAGRPVRVLYVNHDASQGGAFRSLQFLVGGFPKGSVEAHVISPEGPGLKHLGSLGVRLNIVPNVSLFQNIAGVPMKGVRWATLLRSLWAFRHGARLRKVIQRVRPDIVHLNERGMFQAAILAHRLGVPVIMHARSVAGRSPAWYRRIAEHLADVHVDEIIAIDQSVHWSIRENRRCRVIYNPLEAPLSIASASPTHDSPVFRVTYLTGLMEFKGIWDLLEAARILKDRRDIEFRVYGRNSRSPAFYKSLAGRVCVGSGILHDVESEMEQWMKRVGIAGTVRLMGYVPAGDAVFRETDVLVFPSHLNGVGRSVFEAGVFGIPSIVALKDRFEDIVRDQVTGLLIPERDPRALAKAIVRLADDRDLRLNLGRHAREQYSVQFDARKIAAQVLDLYESVLANRARRNDSPKVHS